MSQEPKRGDFAKKKGEIILREHEFDGIQEFDQKLPNWWLFTFYGAIVFFVCYWFTYYGTTLVRSPQQAVQDKIVAVQEAKLKELAKTLDSLNDSKLVHEWAKDGALVAAGEATFAKNCIPCHGADLSATQKDASGKSIALPGRPLTDHTWQYSGLPMQIFKLINEGTPAESPGYNGSKMEAWGQKLTPVEIAQLVAYIITKVPEDFKEIPAPATAAK
jgi:cytochrome c oxidase cbb3-type subunit 3